MSASLAPGADDGLLGVIAKAYGRLRGGAKVLAADGDATEGTAENWLRGRNHPQYRSLVALMAANPSVNEAVRRDVARRIAVTAARRAAWRASYDAALEPLAATESGGDGGLVRRPVLRLCGDADAALRQGVTVDRRVPR